MKTHVLSARIDSQVYDWLYKRTKGKNMSGEIFALLKKAMDLESKKK